MPSYDIECPACGATFEVFRQGFLRDEDRRCTCGAAGRQLLTGFVVSRPSRPQRTTVTGFGGAHGAGCACCAGGTSGREWRGATGGD